LLAELHVPNAGWIVKSFLDLISLVGLSHVDRWLWKLRTHDL
jgi:hypothetical protein